MGKNVKLAVAFLTLASGSLDVTAFLRLGGVFASVMTSNLVFVGIAAVKADASLGKHCAVALVCYIVGVATGTAVTKGRDGTGLLGNNPLTVVLGGELLLLVAYAFWWLAVDANPEGWAQIVMLGTVAGAMGAQGVAAHRIGGTDVATTYLTGTLTNVVGSLTGRRRPDAVATVALIALLVGAAAGAALVEEWPDGVPFLAVVAVLSVFALSWHDERSPQPLRSRP